MMCPTCGVTDSPVHRRGVLHRRCAEIRRMIDDGWTYSQMEDALGVSHTRVWQIVRKVRQPAKFQRTGGMMGAQLTSPEYRTKLSILQNLMAAGRLVEALKLAAKFPQLGPQKAAITRGADALNHPRFYEQLGKNPADLVAAGIAALKERYQKKFPRAVGADYPKNEKEGL